MDSNDLINDFPNLLGEKQVLLLRYIGKKMIGSIHTINDASEHAMQTNHLGSIHGYLKQVISTGDVLRNIGEDLIDLAAMLSGDFKFLKRQFDLHQLLRSVKGLYSYQFQKKNSTLEVDVADEVPKFVIGDPLRFRQLLDILLNTELAYSQTGTTFLKIVEVNDYHEKSEKNIKLKFSITSKSENILEDISTINTAQSDETFSGIAPGNELSQLIGEALAGYMGGSFHLDRTKTEPIWFSVVFGAVADISIQDEGKGNISRENSLKLLGGNEDLLKRLEKTYIRSTPQVMQSLRGAAEAQDFESIHRLAHDLKGTSSTIGVESPGRLAYEIEQAGKNNDIDSVLKIMDILESELTIVLRKLAASSFREDAND